MDKNIKEIKKIVQDLLRMINVNVDIDILSDENSAIKVNLDSPDSALLIGYRGGNLAALQHLVNIIWQNQVRKKSTQENILKIIIDVGSYKTVRLDSIKKMSQDIAEQVIRTGRSEVLPVMSSYERRAVHTALSENKNIITESVGEDPYRRIIIKIKKS